MVQEADELTVKAEEEYRLLQEIHRKQMQIDKLRKEVEELRTLQQHTLDTQVRPALQMIIQHVECRRSVEAQQQICEVDNLPCLLYLMGAMVPLPGHPLDHLWMADWQNWLKDHEAWMAKVIELNQGVQLHPSASDTFSAKEKLYRKGRLQKHWWDELRICAGMPCWKESRNKMYW